MKSNGALNHIDRQKMKESVEVVPCLRPGRAVNSDAFSVCLRNEAGTVKEPPHQSARSEDARRRAALQARP